MESPDLGSSHIPTRSSNSRRSPCGPTAFPALDSNHIGDAPVRGRSIASPEAVNDRRLVADEQYFGLEAEVLRAGARRVLARISQQPVDQEWIDIRHLGKDFHLGAADASALLRTFLTGGLLHPEGTGRYRPTDTLREYAAACVVAPLRRTRAKALIERACRRAACINSDWVRNPFQIEMVAVSGCYMSRRDQLSELSLSLVLGRRPEAPTSPSRHPLSDDDAQCQILEAVNALSSFIVIRTVADREAVQRPFSIVFQVNDDLMDTSVTGRDRFRDWSVSITRWLALR